MTAESNVGKRDVLGPIDFTPIDMEALIRLNQLRVDDPTPELLELERAFAQRYETDSSLAVYGSLAPGRSNHGQLSDLAGRWHAGLAVTGTLSQQGWGVHLGFPALRWAPVGDTIPVQLFVSEELPRHWARLDDFEGSEYQRIVVPIWSGRTVVAIANLYAAKRPQTA